MLVGNDSRDHFELLFLDDPPQAAGRLFLFRRTTGRERSTKLNAWLRLLPRPALAGEGWGEGLLSECAVFVGPVPPHPDCKRDIAEALLSAFFEDGRQGGLCLSRKRGEVRRERARR